MWNNLISLRVWRGFLHPVIHDPLIKRFITNRPRVDFSQLTIWVFLFGLASLVDTLHAPPERFGRAVITLLLVYFLLTAFVQSLLWTVNAADTIKQATRQTGELTGVLPGGFDRLYWLLLTGELYRNASFHYTLRGFRWLIYGLFGALVFATFVSAVVIGVALTIRWALPYLLILMAAVAIGYFNYIQSITGSAIIGLLITARSRTSFDARLWITLAIPIWILGFYVLVILGLQPVWGLSGWFPRLGASVAVVSVFFVVREAITMGFWKMLACDLNNDN